MTDRVSARAALLKERQRVQYAAIGQVLYENAARSLGVIPEPNDAIYIRLGEIDRALAELTA